eukprot:scaffold21281_cov64-Phaeocystis_antarctica.AAC.1
MVSARLRNRFAKQAYSAFTVGALDSAPVRSKCAAASLSSAAERGPASQEPPHTPVNTTARMLCAHPAFGAALTTIADSALSPSSSHHSGLAPSANFFCLNWSKACAVAHAQFSEPAG